MVVDVNITLESRSNDINYVFFFQLFPLLMLNKNKKSNFYVGFVSYVTHG